MIWIILGAILGILNTCENGYTIRNVCGGILLGGIFGFLGTVLISIIFSALHFTLWGIFPK